MIKKFIIPFLLFLAAPHPDWQDKLEDRFRQIDEEFSGNLGVYVKNLGDGSIVNYNADRMWYLASTVKVPLAIAILQKVEDGELSLDDELTLQESDFVDGAGDMLWHEPGTSFTILNLLERAIRESDSTASDMLLRRLGEDEFNEQVRERMVSDGLGPITTILQVRYEAFGELHENVANLTNMDIVEIRGVTPLPDQMSEFVRRISVDESELNAATIPEAFERYYESDLNSGELQSMGLLLEGLAEGEYLNEEHTRLLLDIMKDLRTGQRRIIAGLPDGAVFAHKTGTLISRSCNMGIIYPPQDESPIIVAACAEKYNELSEAESVLQMVGRSLAETWLSDYTEKDGEGRENE